MLQLSTLKYRIEYRIKNLTLAVIVFLLKHICTDVGLSALAGNLPTTHPIAEDVLSRVKKIRGT